LPHGEEAKYDLLVINDSDGGVEKDYLRDVAAPFADPRVGVILKASDEDA
jgi:cellulose synthase/poly-beta-1,6-N-acetylglucosamine synthase-like glycosyltransferase